MGELGRNNDQQQLVNVPVFEAWNNYSKPTFSNVGPQPLFSR